MKGNAGDTIVKKIDLSPELVRVALYIRVSGEEQKIKGLSLEAQQERLEAYARERGWVIVGIYIDAAKTARKNIHKRTDFQRMMDSVKRDEVDILLFCRLDRWFRSVADYYKIMEVLEAHNCDWKTTDEEYDTTTANGRLYINVKLSIAQNEADIDGERIDVYLTVRLPTAPLFPALLPLASVLMRKSGWKLCQKTQPLCKTLSTTLKLRFPSVLLSAISGKPTA